MGISEDISGGFNAHINKELPKVSSATVFLQHFLSGLCEAQAQDRTKSDLAFLIGPYGGTEEVLTDDTVLRRLKKFGDYIGVVENIARGIC